MLSIGHNGEITAAMNQIWRQFDSRQLTIKCSVPLNSNQLRNKLYEVNTFKQAMMSSSQSFTKHNPEHEFYINVFFICLHLYTFSYSTMILGSYH